MLGGVLLLTAAPARAGIDLVRMEGVLGSSDTPNAVGQLTLAIGGKSIPFSVLRAQKMSGMPATGPEIFSALGPGPPPVRVEGRDAMVKKLSDAKPGTPVTIIGNLDTTIPLYTLMEVQTEPSAGAQ